MAITIDQFLHDLTERQLLSQEEAHAVRRRMALPLSGCASSYGGAERMEPGPIPAEPATTLANPARLVLCDAVIQNKLQADGNHLVFSALRIRDKSPVTIHVLVPGQNVESSLGSPKLNGAASVSKEHPPRPQGIADVGRHGEMICVCCESLDGETLEQVVSQNGTLPLELATETLLQTARTLKRLEERGLSIREISPDVLLLDEDGRIHVMGQQLARLFKTDHCHCGTEASAKGLHHSLGKLYAYLQTAHVWTTESSSEKTWPSDAAKAAPVLNRSAKLVFHRLLGQETVSHYPGWEELIRDLETMLRGQELSQPAAASAPARESWPPVNSEEASAKPQSQQILYWIIGLAIAAAAGWATFSLLNG